MLAFPFDWDVTGVNMKTKKPYFKPWDPQPKSKEILEANALELMRYLKWFTRSCKIKGPADTDLYIIGPQWMKGAKKLIKDLEAGVSHSAIKSVACLAIAAAAYGIPAPARAASPDLDPGSKQTGAMPCTRTLWVGGYRGNGIQVGDCPSAGGSQSSGDPQRRRRHGYTDKADKQRARDAHEFFREERKAQREAEKAKEKEARDAKAKKDKADCDRRDADKKAKEQDRKAKDDKAKKCRGLGLPANCTEPNPGHTKTDTGGSSTKKKAKSK